jgi:hypothetical protein
MMDNPNYKNLELILSYHNYRKQTTLIHEDTANEQITIYRKLGISIFQPWY